VAAPEATYGKLVQGKDWRKYAYYRWQNRHCASPVNVGRQVMEDAFSGFLRKQQPDAGYLHLFHKVLDVWNAKQFDSVAVVHKFENQVNEVFGSGSSLALTCLRQNPC
jgi:hypothetical protein